jgi:tetratricopeptide (TPR) repeat protein
VKKSRLLGWVIGSAASVGLLAAGVVFWRDHVARKSEERAFAVAEARLREGQAAAALAIVDHRPPAVGKLDWNDLELRALAGARHLPRLLAGYERDPERVGRNEDAVLLIARAHLHARKTEAFEALRQSWRGREQQPERWTLLDADGLLLAGKPRDAERVLAARTFPTNVEPQRLARLAVLQAPRDPNAAWAQLERASDLDPRNPDIRSFRAQLLEAAGLIPAARVEYVAAHVADPGNPLLRDQLAEFYTRQGSADLALQTWRAALGATPTDFIGLKLAFWSRVVDPAAGKGGTNLTGLAGPLAPLARLVGDLPADRFLDTNQLAQVPGAARLARERREVFWLQVLESLRTGDETNAMQLLHGARPAAVALAPDLAPALQVMLAVRLNQSLPPVAWPAGAAATNRHQFLAQLAAYSGARRAGRTASLPPETLALVQGPQAWTAACLAAGWREAALVFRGTGTGPGRSPEWFTYGVAQCLRYNRTPAAALAFLGGGAATSPALDLLGAELEITAGQAAKGLDRLTRLATADSEVGYRAAWLLALARLENGQTAVAGSVVEQQPRLARSVTGTEILARVALAEGRTNDTTRLYRSIEQNSVEAQAWLARADLAAGDFQSAERRTLAIRSAVPDSMTARANQLKVAEAAAKQ